SSWPQPRRRHAWRAVGAEHVGDAIFRNRLVAMKSLHDGNRVLAEAGQCRIPRRQRGVAIEERVRIAEAGVEHVIEVHELHALVGYDAPCPRRSGWRWC